MHAREMFNRFDLDYFFWFVHGLHVSFELIDEEVLDVLRD